MQSALDWFQTIDFAPTGQKVLALVDATDPCFLGSVLAVLVLLGSKMSSPYPALRTWGLRVALAAALVYVGYTWFTQPIKPNDWWMVLARAGVVAGLVLAPLWIIFPVLLFVYGRLRLALAAFLGYGLYAWLTADKPLTQEDLPLLTLQAGIASGLAVLVAWILQPVIDFVSKNLFPKINKTEPQAPAQQQPAPQPASLPIPAAPQKQLPAPATPAPSAAQLPEELLALFRPRADQKQPEKEEADKRRRRQQSRMKVELCYALHEPILAPSLPRDKFEEFVNRYLSDEFEPEIVESCAQYLEAMLFQQASNIQPMVVQPVTLPDLTTWFLDEQKKIEHESDQDRRKTKLVGLAKRYTELAEKIIEDEAG